MHTKFESKYAYTCTLGTRNMTTRKMTTRFSELIATTCFVCYIYIFVHVHAITLRVVLAAFTRTAVYRAEPSPS